MNLFYSTDIEGGLIRLGEEEARHAVQVLRRRAGDGISVVDGRGGWYDCTVQEAGKKRCVARIDAQRQAYGERPFRLHLAVAPTKSIDRFEWLLEKATEIGVDVITPLRCFHSERRQLRTDRLEKVLVAAMKQSLKAYLPELRPLTAFDEFLEDPLFPEGQRFIAHLGPEAKGHLKDNYRPGKSVTILIGPEGDFSGEEIAGALSRGYLGVTLGPGRLRTETAALAACHIVNLLNE